MKQLTNGLGHALLAQAVIARALIDNKGDIREDESYQELYEPLISVYNELHPDVPVTNPALQAYDAPKDVNLQYVRENAGMYFVALCSILHDYGASFDITEAFITSKRNRWYSRNMYFEKPLAFLELYSGVKWKKEVHNARDGVITVSENSFVVYKRYTGPSRGGVMYKRVHSTTLEDKYKSQFIIFTPIKEDGDGNAESVSGS